MKQAMNPIKRTIFTAGALFLSVIVVPICCAADSDSSPPQQVNEEAAPTTSSLQNYSGLADLITMICDDALERFQGFYGSSVVKVEPFTTIGYYERNKQSELGMTLADQMTATINNETLANQNNNSGLTTQKLNGVLQEVDGFLRIHISGINAAGERTSYVVSVEMSEPIYRALHTYL
ncbi:MAG: hypothetical protein PHI06_00095 [Desulfobulbaceae bacterium]|nr:hypothetical protein [Desulfobulbaceae bacterium]